MRLVGGGVAAWPLVARAQRPTTTAKAAHIAYLGALSPATLDPRQIEQFKAGLVENGLIEGQNITLIISGLRATPTGCSNLLRNSLDAIST